MSTFAGLPFAERPGSESAVVLGAEALRPASAGLRPWHPTLGLDALEGAVDGGSGPVEPWLAGGTVPVAVGGGALAALAAHHGPLALLSLDAHAEADRLAKWARDDLVDPGRSVVAGSRGPLPEPEELDAVRERGIDLLTGDELRAQGPGEYSQRVLARTAGARCVLSLDLDVIDPAFAPAVGTPEVAGPASPRGHHTAAFAGRNVLRGVRVDRLRAGARGPRADHLGAGRQPRVGDARPPGTFGPMSENRVRRRVVAHGRVQGVFFRDTVKREAQSRGVAGWVRNRDDGTVEAVFEGRPDAVQAMVDLAGSGPESADVAKLEAGDEEPEGLSGFEVR